MGIYQGDSGHRTVNKSLAMRMEIGVVYNHKQIILHNSRHWWITEFNPEYQDISADELIAYYLISFDQPAMYYAFKEEWKKDSRWTFYDSSHTAIFVF